MNTGTINQKTYGAVKGRGPLCLFLSANLTPVGLSERAETQTLGGEMCQSYSALSIARSTSNMKARLELLPGTTSQSSSPARRKFGGAMLIMFLCILILGTGVCFTRAEAMTYPANLWQGLIAEACNQGYDGMYAVACCVRNRLNAGMNTGLCALKRKDLDAFCKRQGSQVEKMAKDIIKKVFEQNAPDTVFGATHYENIKAYGWPKWSKDMAVVAKIKDHTFFREVR